jgi:ABC-type nitrate/sulfonate/bicarbonate transport system substrate-binding protein
MRLRRFRASRRATTVTSVTLAGVLIAGCGEVSNTITPPPGTANQVTVVISGQPDGFYVGLYDAEALGYFKATDIDVDVEVPSAGEDPLTMVHDKKALIGIASTPTILLHRNLNEPLVGVAAIVHSPLPSIKVTTASGSSGGTAVTTTTGTTTNVTTASSPQVQTTATSPPVVTATTATPAAAVTSTSTTTVTSTSPTSTQTATGTGTSTTPSTTTIAPPDATLWPAGLRALLRQSSAPTYDGLVIVVRKGTIVDHAGLLRRFVQAVARGYRAARRNPQAAVANLIKEVPSLAPSEALALNTVNAALPYIFPTGQKIWGYQRQAEWNTLGTWMSEHHLISNPNTITDASTNELLQGEGV